MKGQKIRVIIIYILVMVIILLVGYLIVNFFMNNKEVTKEKPHDTEDIMSQCIFTITRNDYVSIIGGNTSNICGGLNKFIINDIILDGTPLDVEVRYYNGTTNDNDSGMYINGKRIIKGASNSVKNNIGIFDNKLFIFSNDNKKPNVVVYDKNGNKVYDLETALSKTNISDPAFVELAKTNNNLDVTVKNSSINSSSFTFGPTEFVFSTAAKGECTPGTNIGSTYKVAFSGDNFTAPEFVSFIPCNM